MALHAENHVYYDSFMMGEKEKKINVSTTSLTFELKYPWWFLKLFY